MLQEGLTRTNSEREIVTCLDFLRTQGLVMPTLLDRLSDSYRRSGETYSTNNVDKAY